MRTLDQIAAEHYPAYNSNDLKLLSAVRKETVVDIVQRMRDNDFDEDKITTMMGKFWAENVR